MEFKINGVAQNNMTHFSCLRGENAYYTMALDGANYIHP
jgi:hypothetical protein